MATPPRTINGTYLLIFMLAGIFAGTAGYLLTMADFGENVDDIYAGEWAVSLIIEHMQTHEGQWPEGWDDLEAAYDRVVRREDLLPFEIEQLKARVTIDFSADPDELAKAPLPEDLDEAPFKVIQYKAGEDRHFEGLEPNRMLLEYLKQRQAAERLGAPEL